MKVRSIIIGSQDKIEERIETVQNTTMHRSTRILRKFLKAKENCYNAISRDKHPTSLKFCLDNFSF